MILESETWNAVEVASEFQVIHLESIPTILCVCVIPFTSTRTNGLPGDRGSADGGQGRLYRARALSRE
jgi:hypothetical protein